MGFGKIIAYDVSMKSHLGPRDVSYERREVGIGEDSATEPSPRISSVFVSSRYEQ